MSAIDDLAELVKTYEDVEETEIPSSIKQAVKEGWELSCDAIALQSVLKYTEEDRKADSQRVITLKAVLQVLSEMEQAQVNNLVLSPGSVVYDFVQGIKNLVPNAIEGFVGLVSDLWNSRNWVPRLVKFAMSLLTSVNKILSAEQLAKSIDAGMKSRDSWAAIMRKRALPQPKSAPRYRVRKKTRKS